MCSQGVWHASAQRLRLSACVPFVYPNATGCSQPKKKKEKKKGEPSTCVFTPGGLGPCCVWHKASAIHRALSSEGGDELFVCVS